MRTQNWVGTKCSVGLEGDGGGNEQDQNTVCESIKELTKYLKEHLDQIRLSFFYYQEEVINNKLK